MAIRVKACTALVLLCLTLALPARGLEDLSFLHVSDVHYPHAKAESAQTVSSLPQGPVVLEAYGVTTPAPSFAVVTGDLMEFGGGGGAWEGYLELWRTWTRPVWHLAGNHDNTWDCTRPRLVKLQGMAGFCFEQGGAKFIGFDTATPQDPRPSVGTEGLRWLEAELVRTPPEQPVFFFAHHPLSGREFASEYARGRLLATLQTRNVVLLLDGHGHGATRRDMAGFEAVMGGSAYGPRRGYGIVSVQDGVLRVCHQHLGPGGKQVALVERPLPVRTPFAEVLSLEPAEGAVIGKEPLRLSVRVVAPERIVKAEWVCDERHGALGLAGGRWQGELPADLEAGAKVVKVELTDGTGLVTTRWRRLWVAGGALTQRWGRQLGGSCQAALSLHGERLYVASNDGVVQALNRADGATVWSCALGGEVRSRPLALAGGRVCVGTSGGEVCCVGPQGQVLWRRQTGAAVYASPALAGELILCANNAGEVLALAAESGEVRWQCSAPQYAIESGFAVAGDMVFVGSWDGFVYAISLLDGTVRWKALSRGSNRASAARYYSPADCAPVESGGRVFVTDRGYWLTVYEVTTGQVLHTEEKCGAVGRASDGGVLVRHTDGRVSKRRADGALLWEAKALTGYLPVAPVEAGGRVWVTSDTGSLTGFEAGTGVLVARQRVAPGLFVFAAPAADEALVCVADETGWIVGLGW